MNRYTWRTGLREAAMVVTALIFLVPVWVLVNIALRGPDDHSPAMFPTMEPTLENLRAAWTRGDLGNAIVNSVVVTAVSVLFIVALAALASYPLARVSRGWARTLFFLFLVGLLLPFQLALIPLYTTIRDLGLLGTLPSLILFNIGRELPLAIFLYTTFLRAIPGDYEEAAVLDGAGRLATFVRVLFPLLAPVTGSVIVLTGVFVYNDFFTPLLYLSGSANQTATVALSTFVGQYRSEWNVVFSGLIISSAPILVLYFILQRTVIKGFGGGLKG
jgi:raffinose/stachyose/melibiose transport system permease protein